MNRLLNIKTRMMRTVLTMIEHTGYCILPKWRLKIRQHTNLLGHLFEQLQIDCVLDVGANRGQFRNLLRHEVGYHGLILSFEPVKYLAEFCSSEAHGDRNWHVFETALGEKDGCAVINVMQGDTFSSFLDLLDSALTRDQFKEDAVFRTKEEVEVRRLDMLLPELMREYRFSNPYLKLDTQGFDLAVLRGAEGVLQSISALQTELSVLPIYRNMPDWIEVIEELQEHGFAVSGMFPVHHDRDSRVIEFDGVFVNAQRVRSIREC